MKRFVLWISLLIAACSAGPIRIMPLGDSITYDDSYADAHHPRPPGVRHAYRNYLWYKLEDAGYWVDFVGSRVAGSDIVPHFDPENEGYSGWSSYQVANVVYQKLVNHSADIVLLHIGSNDKWTSQNSDGHDMSGVNRILNEIDRYEHNYHHHIKVILALIIDRVYHPPFTNTFNHNLRNLANRRISNGDDIYIVDMQHGIGLDYNRDFQDPTHPNNNGYAKMATGWFNALKHFIHMPAFPVQLTTGKLGAHIATLRWQDRSNNENGFRIYRDSVLVATVGKNVTEYTVHDLDARTTYTYTVVAYNQYGDSKPQHITFTTKDDYAWLIPVYYMMGS